MTVMQTREHFGIVGGGLLGLTLALRLVQRGYRVTLLEAADHVGGLADAWQLGDITWDRHYHVSEVLSEALQMLDHAGSIVRENAAQTYFRASPHTAGPFGESIFQSLPPDDRAVIEKVAMEIRRTFEVQNEPARTS